MNRTLALLGKELADLRQNLTIFLPATLVTMAKLAQERAAEAEKLYKQGLVSVAYIKMLGAWVYAASANDTFSVSCPERTTTRRASAALGVPG